jgi:general secretion pathway protein B
MSFILDALKKSEERRRLLEETRKPRQKILDLTWPGTRRWPAWLLLTLLLAALAFGWWLRGAALQSGVEPGGAVSSSLDSPPATPLTGLPPTAKPQATIDAPLAQGPDRPAPFAPVPGEALSKGAAAPAAAAARPVVMAPVAALPADRSRSTGSEIPAALRERMSELSMSLHFYAEEPARRMVRIDNRIVREGQALSEDLVLEEITPGGAIFSFAGERFSVRGPGEPP